MISRFESTDGAVHIVRIDRISRNIKYDIQVSVVSGLVKNASTIGDGSLETQYVTAHAKERLFSS